MKANEIRSSSDLKLFGSLLQNTDVKRVNSHIERMEEKRSGGQTRRHLLATSVRLSRNMAPTLHDMADHCVDRLGIETPLELYAFSSPQFNAACFKPEDGRVFIMFSSSLLEAFSDKELLFVMGHELGHHVYDHHEIPIGYLLRGKQPPPAALALDLFAWSRYAEVSADRAGAYCAEDLHSVARALFRLASGVTSERVVQFDLDEFLLQVDDMVAVDAEPGQGAPMQDWFSTHPFSPLRVKALQEFYRSDLMSAGGISKRDLEINVQDVMQLMEPDYIQGKTDSNKAMRRLFIAGAIAVAHAHNGISEQERATFKSFFKDDDLDIDKLDPDRLRDVLPKRIAATVELTSKSQRMQVLRDLCLIARAEGKVVEPELGVLREIAEGLDIPYSFVLQSTELAEMLD
ncbi:MAG: M48 family metalloprotease [Pseudomonadota bacterium]